MFKRLGSWFGGIGKTLLGWRTYIIVGGLLLSAGFAAGFYTSDKFAEAEKSEMRADMIAEHKQAIDRLIDQHERIQSINNDVMASANAKEDRIETQVRTVRKEITKYVPKTVKSECDCRLNRGAVRLLNIARSDAAKNELGMPGTPSFPDAKARTPSTITQQAEFRAHLQCGKQFRQVRNRLTHLQKWIAKQRKRAKNAR